MNIKKESSEKQFQNFQSIMNDTKIDEKRLENLYCTKFSIL
ncbi:hypothetical protein HMPREF3186_01442 [Gemella haemolysans]|uniref:Uncharacterized protein n=1 Tax=Gemella haemolysans TaxID=1379 RepID=A0A133ZS60_9BACL|nr:hypothetical protein HMPREF3186_01442 [Gemella haemolysans]